MQPGLGVVEADGLNHNIRGVAGLVCCHLPDTVEQAQHAFSFQAWAGTAMLC